MGFVKWHKNITDSVKNKLGLTDYQIMWMAWLKGMIMGGLIVYLYINASL